MQIVLKTEKGYKVYEVLGENDTKYLCDSEFEVSYTDEGTEKFYYVSGLEEGCDSTPLEEIPKSKEIFIVS